MNISARDHIFDFIHKQKITHLVVHGLKTSQHTHRYIHESIHETFLYIAKHSNHHVDVIWCNDEYASKHIYTPTLYNPENRFLIFSTPHLETDKHLPILDNAYYILHFRHGVVYSDVPITKYNELLKQKRAVKYVEFRYSPDNLTYHESAMDGVIPIDKTPLWFDTQRNEGHLAWATNLLPEEIDANIALISSSSKPQFKLQSYFCGHVWRANNCEIQQWSDMCKTHEIDCIVERQKNEKIHQENIRTSFLSTAIQGASQRQNEKKYYIPCRIFKNISYGAIPITNNIGVYNMLNGFRVIYDADINNLMDKALERYREIEDNYEEYKLEQIRVMEYVRDHHTYLNRISTLIQYGFE